MGVQAFERVSSQPGRGAATVAAEQGHPLGLGLLARRFLRPTPSGSRFLSSIVTTVAPQSMRRAVPADSAGPPCT